MFGYVRPPLSDLPEEENARFRRIYCGLCHTLGQKYGPAARFILNYDFTYLAILLSAAEEGPRRESRCIVSPHRRREHDCSTAALGLGYLAVLIMSCFNPGEFVPVPYELMVVAMFAMAEVCSGTDGGLPRRRHT